MGEKNDYTSVLVMDKLVFEKIKFERSGMQNDNEIKFGLQVVLGKSRDEESYKVTIILKGDKEKEYELEISASGYFSFKKGEALTESEKETFISKNAVAIMMPYLRSEVSLLTAQPNVECVVLPTFNINKLMEDK